MKKLLTIAAAALLTTAAFANNTTTTTPQGHIDQILNLARGTQEEAREISQQLKAKNHDTARINASLDTLSRHVAELNKLVDEYEAANPTMAASKRDQLERMKLTAQLLQIVLNQKKATLASGDVKKNRTLLRAKADGIAKRAEMLQQTAQSFRS